MRADLKVLAAAYCTIVALSCPANAQSSSGIDYSLTEDGAPAEKPWEKPALVSGTVDRDGKDYVEVHVNGEMEFDLLNDTATDGPTRTMTLGPSLNWDRSSREGKKQNELKTGAVFRYFYEPNIGPVDPNSNPLFWSLHLNADYSRTAVYPDLKKAPCDATPSEALCKVQHKESLKTKLSLFPYFATFEDLTSNTGWAYSFRPQVQLAHDQILDGTLDEATLARVKGGYTSILLGAGLNLRPGFISPSFELNATAQLRQRIATSSARASLVERSAERMEVSAIYYFLKADSNKDTKDWRVGLSVTWTEGSDPFEDKPDASTITFGLRVGRF